MDDRKQFAALVWAADLGLIGTDEVVAAADRRIMELESPDEWLIDVSLHGSSEELDGPIRNDDEIVMDLLRRAYRAWIERRIPNKQLAECCRSIGLKTRYASRWYVDLAMVDNEFDLVDQGIFRVKESEQRVRERIERIIGN